MNPPKNIYTSAFVFSEGNNCKVGIAKDEISGGCKIEYRLVDNDEKDKIALIRAGVIAMFNDWDNQDTMESFDVLEIIDRIENETPNE